MKIIHGSCLCGGVAFEISGPLMGAAHCHCSKCRKQHSAAFRTRARVAKADFRVTRGEALIRFFESSKDFYRGFCSVCGSPVYNHNGPESWAGRNMPSTLSSLGIALGSLDDDPGVRPAFHGFVAYKAPWYDITAELPQHEEWP